MINTLFLHTDAWLYVFGVENSFFKSLLFTQLSFDNQIIKVLSDILISRFDDEKHVVNYNFAFEIDVYKYMISIF